MVAVTTTVQVKGGMKKQLGKSIAKGAAASLAVSAATGGAMGLLVVAVPPAAWAVVTSQRLLLIERTNADVSAGQSLLRLNLGVKKGAAQEIVAAIDR